MAVGFSKESIQVTLLPREAVVSMHSHSSSSHPMHPHSSSSPHPHCPPYFSHLLTPPPPPHVRPLHTFLPPP